MYEVLPAILVAGVSFATVQLLVGVFHGPWLVDITASVISLGIFVAFLRFWKPSQVLDPNLQKVHEEIDFEASRKTTSRADVLGASLPWGILTVFVVIWGIPQFNRWIDVRTTCRMAVPGLNLLVFRTAPIVAKPTAETAIYCFQLAVRNGKWNIPVFATHCSQHEATATNLSGGIGQDVDLRRIDGAHDCGPDGVCVCDPILWARCDLGLAFARTGVLYPFFGTLIGWMGTAFTGSDTSSNVLFGRPAEITALQLGIPRS